MSKQLIITEKPSVGREIAKVLGLKKKTQGYIEGEKYIVTWALGHLVTLADPKLYNKCYESWRMEDLPMLPKEMKLEVIAKTSKQYKTVKNCLFRKDVDQIIIATDAGREGELVARWIIEKSNCRKKMKRLWISSQTEKAIKQGFLNLKDSKDYDSLYDAAYARAIADWIVGLNVTRALTCKYQASLSAGRVQTPTLAMVVDRERRIRLFEPKEYYNIKIDLGSFSMTYMDENDNRRIFDYEKAKSVKDKCTGANLIIEKVKREKKTINPPLLYDLTTLQREASVQFGFSPKQTLNIMQNLYERHKMLTYPRTDSKYLPKDIEKELKDRLSCIAVGPYKDIVKKCIKEYDNKKLYVINDSKVTDHHAIIPTDEYVDLDTLNNQERKIYHLVVTRFVEALSKPCVYEATSFTASIDNYKFIAKGKRILEAGFKNIKGSQSFESVLPIINEKDRFEVKKMIVEKLKTEPPKHYTESTLLGAMENPEKYVESKTDKKLIKEASGIGTAATRADIMEKLYDTGYIEKRQSYIYSTKKGRQLIKLVPDDLKKVSLTAKWESDLKRIEAKSLAKNDYVEKIKGYAKNLVKEVKNSDEKYQHDNLTSEVCDKCGKRMLLVNNKHGKYYVCQDRECNSRKRISKTSNARCPNCHKKMELYGEGENQVFVCSCGYKEKLTAFKARKDRERPKVSKRDIKKYVKKEENQQPLNSALADALKKWKD